ncbi:MAG: cysteine--tRNA ligase, partial [Lachnospiraceae bacterium]|nr:cysteine--tRNA ligase [Lachnospiraceae bacterium]
VNTAMGLTLVYDVLKSDLNGATKRAVIGDFDYVLGLKLTEAANAGAFNGNADGIDDPDLVAHIEERIAERAAAKKEKNFALADEIREQLLAEGIVLEDTRQGVIFRRSN